jgi:hypothetical protein
MSESFFAQLAHYYDSIAQVLRGQASVASVFPNATDIGVSREYVYAEMLKNHLPSSCNVLLGGFLFSQSGRQSDQIDIIVTDPWAWQFNLTSSSGVPKSFACIDGCLGIVSVKSTLDRTQLDNALGNIATIPDRQTLAESRRPPFFALTESDYRDWPYKIVYASDGWVRSSTLLRNVNRFYDIHPDIPFHKRPNLIHIAGKCAAYRTGETGPMTPSGEQLQPHTFYPIPQFSDVTALMFATVHIQDLLETSSLLGVAYADLVNNMIKYLAPIADNQHQGI